MSVREYNNSMKRVAKLEKQLSAALDKLAKARTDQRPDDVATYRHQAQELETDLEAAVYEARQLHPLLLAGTSQGDREHVPASVPAWAMYRQALRYAGSQAPLDAGLDVNLMQRGHAYHADMLAGDLPTEPPDSDVLDRADEEI